MQRHKGFEIKIYKLCGASGYAYDMRVYVGKNSDKESYTYHCLRPYRESREDWT